MYTYDHTAATHSVRIDLDVPRFFLCVRHDVDDFGFVWDAELFKRYGYLPAIRRPLLWRNFSIAAEPRQVHVLPKVYSVMSGVAEVIFALVADGIWSFGERRQSMLASAVSGVKKDEKQRNVYGRVNSTERHQHLDAYKTGFGPSKGVPSFNTCMLTGFH